MVATKGVEPTTTWFSRFVLYRLEFKVQNMQQKVTLAQPLDMHYVKEPQANKTAQVSPSY